MHVQRLAQGMEIFLQPEGETSGLRDPFDWAVFFLGAGEEVSNLYIYICIYVPD